MARRAISDWYRPHDPSRRDVFVKKIILALGALALVLAITTGAGAAAKRLITGGDVKNGSLTGLDIKNGSVNAGDLSSTATRALSGRSEPGAKGDTGAQGEK